MNDAKRRRQSAGRKQVGKRLRRTAKHIGIVLHLFLFTEMLVYQHIEPTDNIESPFIPVSYTHLIIVGITFEYRRLIIGAEAQVGLVKINQQLRQVIDTEEFHNYLPRNFASFFTVGYKFR